MRNQLLAVMLTTLLCASARSQPTSKPWADMDRGPYFTASVQSSLPRKGMTPKGLLIRVSQSRPAYVLFDTDLLRYSAAWTGASIDWRNVVSGDGGPCLVGAVEGEVFGTAAINTARHRRRSRAIVS